MKRFISFIVAFALFCSCLALAGCSNNKDTDTTKEPASIVEDANVNEDDHASAEETTENVNSDTPNASSNVDNYNPVLGIDGMYTYNIRGHEIKLSINIWDYIGNPEHENLLLLKAITEHYGFTEEVNGDGVYYNPTTDASAGLQHHSDGNTTSVVAVFGSSRSNIHRITISYSAYMADRMDLYYKFSDRSLSLEFAIILAYAMEQTNANPEANPFEFLNEYRESADSDGYFLDCPPIN